MHWLTLTLAILCEVFATTMLKLSDGFTRPLPLLGITVFGEKTDTAGIIGIAFILTGLVILNVFSRMTGH